MQVHLRLCMLHRLLKLVQCAEGKLLACLRALASLLVRATWTRVHLSKQSSLIIRTVYLCLSDERFHILYLITARALDCEGHIKHLTSPRSQMAKLANSDLQHPMELLQSPVMHHMDAMHVTELNMDQNTKVEPPKHQCVRHRSHGAGPSKAGGGSGPASRNSSAPSGFLRAISLYEPAPADRGHAHRQLACC